ncbi:MAG: transcriptional regulator, AraC family protein [Bacteroidetes bacterium]|nr:transcriptional regulator, AraC family protein [Bacteroidota bacterium]
MNTTINVDGFSVFIFLGVFLGLVLSLFFIFKPSSNIAANRFQGFLLLTLTLCILEMVLNMTGFITRVLFITNTTEPLNLIIGPFLYLFIKRSINQYVNSFHPDWPLLDVKTDFTTDPLNVKKYLNLATSGQMLFYISLSIWKLEKKSRQSGLSVFRTNDDMLRSLRNMVLHIFAIILIFIIVKLSFHADLGDYFIGIYISLFVMITTFRVMNDSIYFERSASFMDISMGKYRKSSLNESDKQKILTIIIKEFEKGNYYTENLASLENLAKKIGESKHHVSQVINEKLGKNFFELLASYRIEKAKSILKEDKSGRLTIEEVSEMVGYNSKTAFNNSFRKLTGKTPSEFRKTVNN